MGDALCRCCAAGGAAAGLSHPRDQDRDDPSPSPGGSPHSRRPVAGRQPSGGRARWTGVLGTRRGVNRGTPLIGRWRCAGWSADSPLVARWEPDRPLSIVSIEAAGGGIDRSGAAAEPADLLASAGARQRPLEVGEALTREIA